MSVLTRNEIANHPDWPAWLKESLLQQEDTLDNIARLCRSVKDMTTTEPPNRASMSEIRGLARELADAIDNAVPLPTD